MYFVVYENRPRRDGVVGPDGPAPVSNALIEEHPLLWIDRTTESYRQHYLTIIHFWTEVDDEIAQACKAVRHEPPA